MHLCRHAAQRLSNIIFKEVHFSRVILEINIHLIHIAKQPLSVVILANLIKAILFIIYLEHYITFTFRNRQKTEPGLPATANLSALGALPHCDPSTLSFTDKPSLDNAKCSHQQQPKLHLDSLNLGNSCPHFLRCWLGCGWLLAC